MELIPLLDVIFLLMTFFIFALMLTARLEVTDIKLPVTVIKGAEIKSGVPVVIGLRADGTLVLDNQPTDLNAAIEAVKSARAADSQSPVFIAPDTDARNGDLFELIDAMAAIGVRDLRFLRKPANP
jgi:biopolymer transport protein ExbD